MFNTKIAVIGAGLIGRKHIELVRQEAVLAAIIDPAESSRELAKELGVRSFDGLEAYLAVERPDGIIIATPNQMHVDHGLICVDAGVPMLIEKPIADDVGRAEQMLVKAEKRNVSVLVGHHRRHNPLIQTAKKAIEGGTLGEVVSVNAMFWLYKPQEYFEVDWRKQSGAGPIFINLIHDIDLLRYMCGEIKSVQAMRSNVARGFAVEDSAVILIRFENGALGTVNVSDTIVAPWSWELTSAENPAYPETGTSCYMIGGTKGSLSIPDLAVWDQSEKRSWWEPINHAQLSHNVEDPLVLQIRNFCDVIEKCATPVSSGREGLATLRVVEAIQKAATTGLIVNL